MINFELKETIKISDDFCECYRSKNKHSFLKTSGRKDDIDFQKVKGYIFLFHFILQDKIYIFGKNGKFLTEILTGAYFPCENMLLSDGLIEFDDFVHYLYKVDIDRDIDKNIKECIKICGLTLDYQGKDIQKLINEHYRRFLR